MSPGQYAWFRVNFSAAGPQINASEAEESRLALISFIEHLQNQHGIKPERTIVAGFSQGGILSASIGLSAPELVRGFGMLSARILPELEQVIAPPERLAGVSALIAHGQLDDTLPVMWAERAHVWLDRLGIIHEMRLYPVGHSLSKVMMRDFETWVNTLLPDTTKNVFTLRLDNDGVTLVSKNDGHQSIRIAPGIETLARDHFSKPRLLAHLIEDAISLIEDELARVPKTLYRARLISSSPVLREIATAAGIGVSASTLNREAVEQVFACQSAAASRHSISAQRTPNENSFIAGLLLIREIMHHLDIELISMTPIENE
jgi:phospholipase/carboxylesterase